LSDICNFAMFFYTVPRGVAKDDVMHNDDVIWQSMFCSKWSRLIQFLRVSRGTSKLNDARP
jgi:hypothetical protein